MEYSTGNTHLLSAILTEASRESTWEFANEALASRSGFTLLQWPRDPQGIYFGGNDMLFTPRQMLAFGELYLNGAAPAAQSFATTGWSSPAKDARDSPAWQPGFRPQTASSTRCAIGSTDTAWWGYKIRGYDTCFAWGYGGQYIFVDGRH